MLGKELTLEEWDEVALRLLKKEHKLEEKITDLSLQQVQAKIGREKLRRKYREAEWAMQQAGLRIKDRSSTWIFSAEQSFPSEVVLRLGDDGVSISTDSKRIDPGDTYEFGKFFMSMPGSAQLAFVREKFQIREEQYHEYNNAGAMEAFLGTKIQMAQDELKEVE